MNFPASRFASTTRRHLLALACASLLAPGADGAPPPPGARSLVPRMFAAGTVSTTDDEAGGSLSPDGREFYFVRLGPYTTFPRVALILVSRLRNGRWSAPEVVPFSGGRALDLAPRVTPDGAHLLFASTRPAPGHPARTFRIWSVARSAAGFGEPQVLDGAVNVEDRWNMDPSVSAGGTLYFASDREEPGRFQIYRSRFAAGRYQAAEKLGPEVNSAANDLQPCIAADEQTLVFVSRGVEAPPYTVRPQDRNGAGAPYPRGDIYVSTAVGSGWTPARPVGHGVNTIAEEGYPSLTADGRFLFFHSQRGPFGLPLPRRLGYTALAGHLGAVANGRGNIYLVSSGVLKAQP